MKIAYDAKDSDDLPDQLVIRGGRVVLESTGEPPRFPEAMTNGAPFDGIKVSIVIRADLQRLMEANTRRRKQLESILLAIEASEGIESLSKSTP